MTESVLDPITVSVWRGNARQGGFQNFQVPQQPSQTILDVVTWIQRHLDASLSYRFACRVGMCGSCAMMVNGIPRWTCRTHVNKVMRDNRLSIEPLRNLPVIKDLACDMSEFFDKWKHAEGHFSGKDSRAQPVAMISPASEPVVALARASLADRIGRVPLQIVSDRPFDSEPDEQIIHLDFPFDIDRLHDKVKKVLLRCET